MDIETKALTWIKRWKLVGGGFEVKIGPSGPTVQLLRKVEANPRLEDIAARTAGQIEQRLRDNPAMHAVVCELVAQAWAAKNVANDVEQTPEPPEAA